MKLITWDQTYSVNIEEIDAQHQWLIEIINTLNDSLYENKSNKLLAIILDSLVEYIQIHFTTEEQLMIKYNYPEYESHKSKHEELKQNVNGWKDAFIAGQGNLNSEVLGFLKGWLENHEVDVDKPLGVFLNAQGVK